MDLSAHRPRRSASTPTAASGASWAAFALGLVLAALIADPATVSAQPLEEAPLLDDTPPPNDTTDPNTTQPGDGSGDNGGGGDAGTGGGSTGMLIAEFGLEERNVVLSAAKTRTTIQEAPAIVTVITAEEIRSRGYRTLNDILQTLPGFEGDRWDGNGWTEESFARGTPRGLLILVNGVNIVDPLRNTLSLDRKIPLEAIQRIEIVSGPGGVLWGSNALLGIVNIIPRTGADFQGVTAHVGAGTGPGELDALKVGASAGGQFLDDKLRVFTHVSFFTTRSAELQIDQQKVVGVLPPPSNDGTSLFLPGPATTEPSREYFFNVIGQASLYDVTLEWMLPYERDARQLATGGAVLTEDYRLDTSGFVFPLETEANDNVTLLALGYQSRFASESFGLSAKSFFTSWALREDPFGAFPASSVSPRTQYGVFTRLEAKGVYRYGLNLDMDLFAGDHHIIFGGELFQDRMEGIDSTTTIDEGQLASLTDAQRATVDFQGPEGAQVPLYTEPIVLPSSRTIGALYLRDEWKLSTRLALSGGARLQVSDAYDPTTLLSGAMVVNLIEDTYLKLNYAEGFRPPNFQAQQGNNDSVSDIRFEANPNLDLESSRAGEIEINTVLLRGSELVDNLYLRADYSLTQLDDLIVVQSGRFVNSGTRLINSVEALGRLDLRGGHELWAGYYFATVEDSTTGPIRNIPNHIFNTGLKVRILKDLWEVSGLLTYIGPREDRNRAVDPSREPFTGDFVAVRPTDVVIDEIEPTWLLRVGTRLLDLYDTVTVSAFGYNVLNQQWSDPDLFFDDRIMTRPFPKPRWSVFLQIDATWEPEAQKPDKPAPEPLRVEP